MRGHEGQIDVAAFADRLAPIERFQHGKVAHFFLQETGDAKKVFRPLASRHLAPRFLVGPAGRLDRLVDIRCISLRHFGQLLLRRRIDRGEILSGRRADKLAVDEQVVARPQLDVRVGLGRGRVVPATVETQRAVADRHHRGVGRGRQGGHARGENFGLLARGLAHGREK